MVCVKIIKGNKLWIGESYKAGVIDNKYLATSFDALALCFDTTGINIKTLEIGKELFIY